MTLKLNVTKIAEISAGILKDDTHSIPETFTIDIPDEYVLDYSAGEILQQPEPEEFLYTLLKSQDGTEKIVFSSEGDVPNPWKGENLLIIIPGKTNETPYQPTTLKSGEVAPQPGTVDPVSGWNYNTWNITSPVTIGEYTITDVKISDITTLSETRVSVRAKITIVSNTGTVFGPNFVVSRSGYLLLSTGLTREGPQEVDLANGSEILDGAIILNKIGAG